MNRIISTAEPFLLPGDPGKPGCLLIHGFTGTPKEMQWMGEFLSTHGLTCLGVRLAGHATALMDMIRSRYTDWLASVEDGYRLLRGIADSVFLVGLSMGGVLALRMAAELDIRGVVAMSTPYSLPADPRLSFAKLISRFVRYVPKGAGDSSWVDHVAEKDHVAYPQNPVRSIGELNELLREMRAALPRIRVPVLLMHSRDDRYVSPQSMELIQSNLDPALQTATLSVSGSGHVLTRDAARDQVFRAALEFIQTVQAG